MANAGYVTFFDIYLQCDPITRKVLHFSRDASVIAALKHILPLKLSAHLIERYFFKNLALCQACI